MNVDLPKNHNHKPKVGIALGIGSARGMAHVGVIQRLAELGIEPDIVCGTSMGSMIGAVHACGKMNEFAEWVSGLSNGDILRYMDVRLLAAGGVAEGGKLMEFCGKQYGNPNIEDLKTPYACVATELHKGREIWLQEGNLWQAVRASIALPGILTPVGYGHSWLVDGGLVNPVPVSLCRAMGAEITIAVDLNTDLLRPASPLPDESGPDKIAIDDKDGEPTKKSEEQFSALSRLADSIKEATENLWGGGDEEKHEPPGTLNVLMNSINIMQDRITRSRMAGEPPDVVISPRLAHIGFLEFNRGAEAIEIGRAAVDRVLPAIRYALQLGDDHESNKASNPENTESKRLALVAKDESRSDSESE